MYACPLACTHSLSLICFQPRVHTHIDYYTHTHTHTQHTQDDLHPEDKAKIQQELTNEATTDATKGFVCVCVCVCVCCLCFFVFVHTRMRICARIYAPIYKTALISIYTPTTLTHSLTHSLTHTHTRHTNPPSPLTHPHVKPTQHTNHTPVVPPTILDTHHAAHPPHLPPPQVAPRPRPPHQYV
jgi:hypothetical protein